MGVAYFMRFDWFIKYDSAGIIGKSFVQFSGGRVRSLSPLRQGGGGSKGAPGYLFNRLILHRLIFRLIF